jgi:hypothetical protein
MLDQLMDLVKKHAGDAIVNNPDIPNSKNEEAIHAASDSISGGLQNMFSQGGIQDILKMFGGNTGGSTAVSQNVTGGFIQNLMDKFNLNQYQAQHVADKVVPGVLDDMVKKTNDPDDNSFDIQGIFNNLSAGKTSGFNIQGLLNKVKGGQLDLDGDGDTDLQDLLSLVKGGSNGNLMDKVKGLFAG